MIVAFYILVGLQLVAGVYSLWAGFQWLQMVRLRLRSHSGFYAPVTALICPCKGAEPGLEENLAALTRFDYPSYEIYFTLATSLDPAIKIIERIKAGSQVPVHIVIAGPPQGCGEKVYNLRRAVESLPENFEVLAFTDSDVRLPRGWLAKLIAPLQDPRIGATTTYRWIVPSRGADSGMASALASAWNAAIATMQTASGDNFCWGGGIGIRRAAFGDARVLEFWQGAASDDLAMTNALQQAGKPIAFCPECLAPTLHPWTGHGLIEFTNRQILIARVYAPRRWKMGALAHLGYCATLIYAAFVILAAIANGDPWLQLLFPVVVVPLLAAMKGVIRTIAIGELLPECRARLREWSWVLPALAPVVPFLFSWNFISSLLTRRMRWRGVSYELVSPSLTRILSR